MRVLIIGVGAVGAMAAWRLAQSGQEVLAFEQFKLDHDRGSSYGDSRIVRRVYPDALYTHLMADAYVLWDELQEHFPQQELFRRSGGLFFGRADNPLIAQALRALKENKVACEVLDANECSRRFPAVVLRPEEVALFEPSMAYARASRCVVAAAQLARQGGASIFENTAITAIDADSAGVRITTAEGKIFEGDRLLLTAGPWTGPRLAELGISVPLVVTRQAYVHLEPETDLTTRNSSSRDAKSDSGSVADVFGAGRFPIWIDGDTNFYGFPQLGDVSGVKIALHAKGQATTPELVDRRVTEEEFAATREYARQRFPLLSERVVYSKVCLYTNTPDEDFIIDALPNFPNTYLIGGLSGHGFKFTPLLGQILADLAQAKTLPYDLTRFRLNRFSIASH